jgi:hypothetical protein
LDATQTTWRKPVVTEKPHAGKGKVADSRTVLTCAEVLGVCARGGTARVKSDCEREEGKVTNGKSASSSYDATQSTIPRRICAMRENPMSLLHAPLNANPKSETSLPAPDDQSKFSSKATNAYRKLRPHSECWYGLSIPQN